MNPGSGALTPAAYDEVLREIESRATDYSGQVGADVDWLLAQVHAARLGTIAARARELDRAVNAWIGCEAPRIDQGGPYWRALQLAQAAFRAVAPAGAGDRERNAWMLLRRILAAKPEHIERHLAQAREWLARQEVLPSDFLRAAGAGDPKWIRFDATGPSDSGKTQTWRVVTRDGDGNLGRVAWFGRWRRYAFFPFDAMVFEHQCLRDIAAFCEQQTAAQRAAKVDA